MRFPLAALLCAALSACTWVKLEDSGRTVRVALPGEDLSRCTYKGEVGTEVTNRVAGIERNSIKVREELETMARNEAPGLGGNTIQALGEPVAGEQRFAVYACP